MIDSVSDSTVLFVLFSILVLLLVAIAGSLCYAVWLDAASRGANPAVWTVFAFVLPIAAIPVYAVYCIRGSRDRETPPGSTERTLWAVGIGGTIGLVVAAFVTPPDPVASVLVMPPLVIVFIAAVRAIDRYRGSTASISGQ
ncbi:hypothetical protein [Natrinema salinisoli]|uniref:hypothetical protein n=1 Tax=Natrinema salinisoli TaxID=2878535 RepID=UPI001CF0ACE8|nr:hypothetical protein [Natrinema salinisoli]